MKKTNKPFVYLASPYTDPDRSVMEQREQDICAVAAKLIKQGHIVYCPIAETAALARSGHMEHTDWEFWREKDLKQVSVSDELWIVTLHGWQQSKGVRGEAKYCFLNSIPVRLCDPDTLKVTYHYMHEILEQFDVRHVHELND